MSLVMVTSSSSTPGVVIFDMFLTALAPFNISFGVIVPQAVKLMKQRTTKIVFTTLPSLRSTLGVQPYLRLCHLGIC